MTKNEQLILIIFIVRFCKVRKKLCATSKERSLIFTEMIEFHLFTVMSLIGENINLKSTSK